MKHGPYCAECQQKKGIDVSLILPATPKHAAYLCPECGERLCTGSWMTVDQLVLKAEREEWAAADRRINRDMGGPGYPPGGDLEVRNPRETGRKL